jgi:hypothetical protein
LKLILLVNADIFIVGEKKHKSAPSPHLHWLQIYDAALSSLALLLFVNAL